MARMREWTFLLLSILLMFASLLILAIGTTQWVLYAAVILLGLANSNPFSIIMAKALKAVPNKKNEASGLMIMGLFGGTVFPLLMGAASDNFGQTGAIVVLALGALYLLFFWKTNKD
jgi:fucose permease